MQDQIEQLQRAYDKICQRIEPSSSPYTFLTKATDTGAPHVEFADDIYHYVVTERGLELERRSTGDPSEILYWMVHDLTFWMSVKFEFENRVAGQDVRRIMFEKRLELMKRADVRMAVRLDQDIAKTLAANPFVD